MMSCRAMGRGVVDALLAWLVRQAARAGAGRLRVPCVVNSRNVPLRLALAAAGFRVPEAAGAGDQGTAPRSRDGGGAHADEGNGGGANEGEGNGGVPAVYQRDAGTALPDLPGWVQAPGERGGDAA
jgi:hypothetical protein